jgi:hypothetical protein
MSKNSLYVNSKGYEVTYHSYSGSEDYNFCPRKYELKRIVGWTEKELNAALAFGNAIEAAVRHHHGHGSGAAERFDKEWEAALKDPKNKDMVFSKVEVDAENLAIVGREMIQLYALRLPNFPYYGNGIQFQMERRLEVFPNDPQLSGITFTAYLDMLVKLKENDEKCVLDCKTSGARIPDWIMLDPQLQAYSWVEKCPNVGFLWFQKVSRTVEKGSDVTVLLGEHAGMDGIVLQVEDDDPIKLPAAWVATEEKLKQMDALFPPRKKSAEVLAAKSDWLLQNAKLIPFSSLTRQRVHVRLATIPKKLSDDRGQSIGNDIARIHQSSEENFFPQLGGVRYPSEKCPYCCMRGICAGDDRLRDEILTRKQTDDLGIVLGKDSI